MTVSTGESIADVEARYDGQGYGAFKEEVAEAVIALLEPFQARFSEIREDDAELHRLLALGAEKARETSRPTLEAMYERMGFVRPATG
jgi:tryptophanyl-tRNA synthetase